MPSFIKQNFMKCRCSGFLFALNSNILICGGQTHWIPNYHVVGGLKYVLCSSLFGEMIQFNYCFSFQIGLKPPASHQFCGPQNANVFGSTDDRPFKMWPFAFMVWSNYSDLTRPHPKWWFSKGNPLISGIFHCHVSLPEGTLFFQNHLVFFVLLVIVKKDSTMVIIFLTPLGKIFIFPEIWVGEI